MNTVGLVLGSGHIGKIHALRLESRGVKCLCVDGKERCLEMLRKAKIGDFGFVLVATPASSHFEYAKRALELGANVFVEKPLATSSAEAKVLVSLAKTREKLLFVGHSERFNPAFERFRETFCSEISRVRCRIQSILSVTTGVRFAEGTFRRLSILAFTILNCSSS